MTNTAPTNRFRLLAAVFAIGTYAVIAQSVLVREVLVVSFGVELTWGIVFFGWLLGIAVGSYVGGHLRVAPRFFFCAALAALPFVACAAVALVRVSRGFFDAGPGEYLSLWSMLWVYPLLTLPVSVVVGFAFPVASQLAERTGEKSANPIANVYAMEALGALVGGALFSFVLVERVGAFALLGYSGALLVFAACCSIQNLKSKIQNAAWAALPCLALAVATWAFAPAIERWSTAERWATFRTGTEIVPPSPVDSRYQNITLGRRENEFTVFLDGLKAMSFPDPALAADAHFVMCEAKSVKRVLLIGGGIEGTLAEMLKHPVERIDVVTLDPKLVALARPHLSDADRAALDDPRVQVHYEDGRRFLVDSSDDYDLAWLDVPEPASLLMNRFYTREFFALARSRVADNGLLALRLTASPDYFSDARRRYLGSVVKALRESFPNVLATWGETTFVLASPSEGVFTAEGAELSRRYRERGVASARFDPLWFEGGADMLQPERVREMRAEIATGEREARTNTDTDPRACLLQLALREEEQSGTTAFAALARLSAPVALAAAAAAALAWFAAARFLLRKPWRECATLFSVGSTGFATMALSLVLLAEFQLFFGYVYARVGVLVGVFMLGLVAGSLVMKRRLRRNPALGAPSLARHDIAIAALAAAAAFPLAGEAGIYALILAAGCLGGLIFPLAASLMHRPFTPHPGPLPPEGGEGTEKEGRGDVGRVAGSVAAADNVGACLGALLAGVVLVPALGFFAACALLMLLKLISAVALFAASRTKP